MTKSIAEHINSDMSGPRLWNDWRKNYDKMSDKEHRDFYNKMEKQFPNQKHFTKNNWEALFDNLRGVKVLEVGGWKGELADYCLAKYPIKHWTNIEICQRAIENTVCTHPNYLASQATKLDWFKYKINTEYDVIVASHLIEHLSDEDFKHFAKFCSKTPVVAFEAPLDEVENDWHDYIGSHILKMGWRGVDALMSGHKPNRMNKHFTIYNKR